MTPRAAAMRYARALFDVALKERVDLDALERELAGVVNLMASNPALERVVTNPAIPPAKKRAVIEQLIALSPVTPMLARTLLLLADRDRLAVLPDLLEGYRNRVMDYQKVVRAELTTAVALPGDRVTAVQQSIATATGRRVHLQTRVDPAIIGGAVTRIGSTVYDGSVTSQLQRLKERLITSD
jgi:F-type H+-transporting ATPase subunit delta